MSENDAAVYMWCGVAATVLTYRSAYAAANLVGFAQSLVSWVNLCQEALPKARTKVRNGTFRAPRRHSSEAAFLPSTANRCIHLMPV